MSLASETIASLRAKLSKGEITSTEIVTDVLAAIEKSNPALHAYLSVDAEMALKEAAAADTKLPLGGIPIAFKDNINVLGQPCTCGSRILENTYTAPYDATVTRKLRAAGVIPLGRANLDEFAMGSS